MAVDARQRQFDLFTSRNFCDRDLMMNGMQGIGSVCAGYGTVVPLPAMETAVPSMTIQAVPVKTAAIKSESGLSCAVPVSRKRSRDAMYSPVSPLSNGVQNQIVNNRCGSSYYTFLGEDFSFHFLQQQLEIDRFIVQQTEKLRMEIRKRFSDRVAAAVQENMAKKLKVKDEELDKIGKLNFALEERLKSLFVENQILKDLAQTNEATANALRCNLEQVLAQIQDENQQQDHQRHHDADEDAESCCGSTCAENQDPDYRSSRNRLCRRCGKVESCVLLLPCRHLCLCEACGSSIHTCPVCNTVKTTSLNVSLSAS